MAVDSGKIFYAGLKIGYAVIYVVTLILLVAVMGSGLWMFKSAIDHEIKLQALQIENASPARPAVIDKVNDSVDARLTRLENEKESVLSDLRQESNNIINKFNAWLGFWIAILAIFGGIVPIVIQYLSRRKDRQEISKILDRLRAKAAEQQALVLVSNICYSEDDYIISESVSREAYIHLAIQHLYEQLKEIIDVIDQGRGYLDYNCEMTIVNILIQYWRLIERLKPRVRTRKTRELTTLQNELTMLISDMLNHKHGPAYDNWQTLLNLLPRLSSLTLT